MRYILNGVQQEYLCKLGLDIIDANILQWLVEWISNDGDFRQQMDYVTRDGEPYFYVSYNKVMDEFPVFKIKSISGVAKRFNKFEKIGLVKQHTKWKGIDTRTYFSVNWGLLNLLTYNLSNDYVVKPFNSHNYINSYNLNREKIEAEFLSYLNNIIYSTYCSFIINYLPEGETPDLNQGRSHFLGENSASSLPEINDSPDESTTNAVNQYAVNQYAVDHNNFLPGKQKTESYNGDTKGKDSFSTVFNKESYVRNSLNNITFPEIVTQLLALIPGGNNHNNIKVMNKHINNYGLDAVMGVARTICDKYTVGALSSANWQYIVNALKETRQSYLSGDGIYHCRCGLQHEIINIDVDTIRCGCGDDIDVDHVLSLFKDVDDVDDVFDEIQHVKNFQ